MKLKASLPLVLIVTIFPLVLAQIASAGSATWKANPTSADWNTAANWTPATIPNGPVDTATFQSSAVTNVSLSAEVEVSSIIFASGASRYTIDVGPATTRLDLSGAGITNTSGESQSFQVVQNPAEGYGLIAFLNDATAGQATSFTTSDDGRIYFYGNTSAGGGSFINNVSGTTYFYDTATAGEGTFVNNGSSRLFSDHGAMYFFSDSTAGNAMITNQGGSSRGTSGGLTQFLDDSTAGEATLIANGGAINGAEGGRIEYIGDSKAGNATLIATGGLGRGGLIRFVLFSSGGTPRVKVYDNGTLDISEVFGSDGHRGRIKIGSLEGNGLVSVGRNILFVGGNNLNTTYSGSIQNGAGGSVVKEGEGRLILSSNNFYTGGTNIKKGKLLVTNATGSATGSGPVTVGGGFLGGTGIIEGAVRVTPVSGGASLAPGIETTPGTLTLLGPLAFGSLANYRVDLDLSAAQPTADSVQAFGTTIDPAATISFGQTDNITVASGTVFTLIDNTSTTSIKGTFSNLDDGATVSLGSNTFQANYQGGDGNDLTLTVVP